LILIALPGGAGLLCPMILDPQTGQNFTELA
jgi:hypothetical protein